MLALQALLQGLDDETLGEWLDAIYDARRDYEWSDLVTEINAVLSSREYAEV